MLLAWNGMGLTPRHCPGSSLRHPSPAGAQLASKLSRAACLEAAVLIWGVCSASSCDASQECLTAADGPLQAALRRATCTFSGSMQFRHFCEHLWAAPRVILKKGTLTVKDVGAEYALEAEGQHGERAVRLVALVIPYTRAPVQDSLLSITGQLVHQSINCTGQHLAAHQKSFLSITLRGLFSSVTSPLVTYAGTVHVHQLREQASCLP